MILEDDEIILKVLTLLQKSSVMMLLPHLKEWFYSSAAPSVEGYSEFKLRYFTEYATFHTGGIGSLSREEDVGCFYTINGLYREFRQERDNSRPKGPRPSNEEYRQLQAVKNTEQRAKYPILRLVDEADSPHSWSVVARLADDLYQEYLFLVNFEQWIFWRPYFGDVICV